MKSFFHKGYFTEMFRQLRVAGIVAAAILMLSNLTEIFSIIEGYFYGYSESNYIMPGGTEMAMGMMSYVYIASVLFIFLGFGWLNKRSTSDFYHALPVLRSAEYFSTFFAAAAWLAIGIGAYAIVHALIYLVFGAPFNYLLFLCVVVNMFIGALEVAGASALACAITGTRFVNIFAAAVILFMPRFMLTVLEVFVISEGPHMLAVSTMSIFFDPTYNIIATPYMNVLNLFGTAYVDYANGFAMLWSFAYSLLLILLGGLAFKKRSSETAGIPTKSKLFQAVVRTAVGLPLLLLLVYLLSHGGVTSAVVVVLLVLFSFVFYCLYELISTKSIKKMAKAMPLYLICIGVSALYLVLPKLIINIELARRVDSDNLVGYRNSPVNTMSYFFDGLPEDDVYLNAAGRTVEFKDPESLEIIVRAYERTVRAAKNEKMNDYSGATSYRSVVLHLKTGYYTRNLMFTSEESSRLDELALSSNEKYARLSTEFPNGVNFYSCADLTIDESREIGELFRQEYENLTPEQKRGLKASRWGETQYYYDSFRSFDLKLCVYGCYGAYNYSNYYYITKDTPRTAARYVELLNDKFGEHGRLALNEIKKWFETGGENSFNVNVGQSVPIYFWGMMYAQQYYSGENNSSKLPMETDPEFYEMLKILCNAPLTNDLNNAAIIRVDYSNYYFASTDRIAGIGSLSGYFRFAVSLSDEEYQRLIELQEQHNIRAGFSDYDKEWAEPEIDYDF